MYEAIWTLNEEHPERFEYPGVKYSLRFVDGYEKGNAYFTLWLEHHLSYGDTFQWPFINARQKWAYVYYVDQIGCEFTNGKQTLNATLRSGLSNYYRKMLYDKADFLDLIGSEERYQLTDHELDKLLIHRVEQKREGYPKSLSYLRSRKPHF